MTATPRNLWSLVLLVAAAGVSAGCQDNRVKDERDALLKQNRDLQGQLTQSQAGLSTVQSERNALAQQLAQLQSRPAPAPQPAPAPVAAANTGFSAIEGVETYRSIGRTTVRVPGDLLFPAGSANLKPSALKTLDQIAAVIKKEYPAKIVRIEGYTDADPIKRTADRWEDNLDLSLSRSAEVYRYLQQRGLDPKKLYAAGFGEHFPAATKPRSRRVEIVVLTD
jgi:chemotaxis protein MotB